MKAQVSFRNAPAGVAEPDFVVVSHHPDRLNRPAVGLERGYRGLEQTLTWNIFRTLELLPPAFWLRRLRARLQDSSLGAPAPTIGRVSLWRALQPSPALSLSDSSAPVTPDVLIETEFTVWTLMTLLGRDVRLADDEPMDPVMRVIDAGSWHAGAREYCFGLIVSDPADAPFATARTRHYAQHRAHVLNRLSHRADGVANLGAIGVARWTDLREILEDCAASDALRGVENALATRALDWLATCNEDV